MIKEASLCTTHIWNESQTLNSEDFLFRLLTHHLAWGVIIELWVCWARSVWRAEAGDIRHLENSQRVLRIVGRQKLIKSKKKVPCLKILLRTNPTFFNPLFYTSKQMLRHFLHSVQLHRVSSWSGMINTEECAYFNVA